MQDNYKTAAWRIIPTSTPTVLKKCTKCNKKMEFYCSERFRVNANSSRVDIWLIYKCIKCDSTWKLTIKKGIRPQDIPRQLFDQYISNDKSLAWTYAFDRNFLKQNDCTVQYSNVGYTIEGLEDLCMPMHVKITSQFSFDLKLSALLAGVLGISVSKLQTYVRAEAVTSDCDIMKYRIRADLDVYFHCDLFAAC